MKNYLAVLSHLAAGYIPVTWSISAGLIEPSFALLFGCAIAALLPDIDSSASYPGRILYPFSRALESRFGHRTITHSLIAIIIFAALMFALLPEIWIYLAAAYTSHILLDMLIGDGVPLLYPATIRFEFARIRAGSSFERWITFLLFALVLLPLPMPQIPTSIVTASQPPPPTPTPTATPTLTPTPQLATVRIENITDPAREIRVHIGDDIAPGDILAQVLQPAPAAHCPTATPAALSITPSPAPCPTVLLPVTIRARFAGTVRSIQIAQTDNTVAAILTLELD